MSGSINVHDLVPKGGFLGGWLQHAAPFEYPDAFPLYALFAVAAAAVNGRVQVNPEGEPCVFTNTYVVLYGPSGSRKSTAIRHAKWLLHEAVEEAPILPQSFTMESLISRLARDSEGHGKGAGLILSDELSDLIGGAEYKMQNTKFLTDIWDCPGIWMRETQTHGQEVITNPYVSLLAASAPDWLEMTDPASLAGGYLRRTLFVVEYGPKQKAPKPVRDTALFKALVKVFRDRLKPDAFDAAYMVLTDEAHDVMGAWYEKVIDPIRTNGGEREAQFASCMQAHALKLGALAAILEGGVPEVMEAKDIRIGQGLVEALVPGTFHAYRSLVPSSYARLRAAIMRTVRLAGGRIEATDLVRRITDSMGVEPKPLNSALGSLVRDGRLSMDGKVITAEEKN